MSEYDYPEPIDKDVLIIQAVDENNYGLAKYLIDNENITIGMECIEFIGDDSRTYSSAISLAKTLKMAKLLVPDPIDFSDVPGIELVGSNMEACEYYLTVGLNPDQLSYEFCYDHERFIKLGVTKQLIYCRITSDDITPDQIDLIIKGNEQINYKKILYYDPKIIDRLLFSCENNLVSITKIQNGYEFGYYHGGEVTFGESYFTNQKAKIFYKHGYEFEHPCQGSMIKNARS